ncbi:hypothetical protein QA995_42565 [Streptomyces scabiei]|uniref:hypothetical protein n=1 Tax=Streptomyces scabiei TaxID=1930 RepID=UPI002FEF9E95
MAQDRRVGPQLDGPSVSVRTAGRRACGELDEALLGEGAARVVGVEEGAGGVGGGAGASFGGGQLGAVQAAGRGEGGVEVAEVAADPDPVQRTGRRPAPRGRAAVCSAWAMKSGAADGWWAWAAV